MTTFCEAPNLAFLQGEAFRIILGKEKIAIFQRVNNHIYYISSINGPFPIAMLNNQRVCFIFFKHGFRLRRVFGTRMVAISPSTHAAPAIAGASVFLYIYRVDHPSRAMFDLPSTLVIPNRAWIGLPHGSEVSGSAWAEPKQDQKALRSCKITQVLRKSSPQSVAFFRSAGFGVSFQLSTNQTQ